MDRAKSVEYSWECIDLTDTYSSSSASLGSIYWYRAANPFRDVMPGTARRTGVQDRLALSITATDRLGESAEWKD